MQGMLCVGVVATLVLSAASASADVTVRKVGENIQIVRATGELMVKGKERKPNPPRLSYSCTVVNGQGVCEFSVVVNGKQQIQKQLDITHDDGDLLVAGTCTVSRKARTFEWDWEDGNVLTLVPGT
jgi:hypothetical protein